MNRTHAIEAIEKPSLRAEIADFEVGDDVRVALKVTEGDKSRIQNFEGTVIRRRGRGTGASFTVLKAIRGSQDMIEKIFPLHSPFVEKVTVLKKSKVRRACLYYKRKKKEIGT